MSFIRRIRQYRVYRRMVLGYLSLLVLSITLLSVILYVLFSSKAVQEIDRSSRQILAQVSYTSNVVYGQVQDITGQLLSDNEIISFVYAKTDDKKVNYTASLFLARIQSVYPFIQNLSIYNFTTDAYIDTLGLPPDPGFARKDEKSYFGFFPREVNGLRLLTFKIVPERSFTEAPKSAIVVDLDERYLRNTMRNISASTKDSLTFVMDASGTVLSHTSPEHFMEDFGRRADVRRILADTSNQGSFVERIDGQKHLVTFVKSANLDWYFVSVRPYSELISNIYELRNWTIVVVLLLIAAGAGISLMLSGNIYNPIRKLMDKVSASSGSRQPALLRIDEYEMLTDAFTQTIEQAKTMESTLRRSARALRDGYIAHLLKGDASKTAVSADMIREWESRLSGPYLTVLLFKVDEYRTFKTRHGAFDRGLLRFAISNIAHELLSRSYRIDAAHLEEEDEIAFILQTDAPRPKDKLYLILGEIQDTVRSYYRISLSVSVGDPCESTGELSDAYKSAQSYMNARLFLGHGCLASRATGEGGQRESDSSIRYPAAIEKRLKESVKLGNRAAIRAEIVLFREQLSSGSYAQAMQYAGFLALGIVKEFEYVTEWWSVDSEQLYRAVEDIRDVETLDDVERLLAGLCGRIADILEENKRNTSVAKNAKIVEEIQLYVQEHFAEHGLSLESAADRVGFSSGYVGKLFKSMTGTTFNDFVTQVRMEQAKLLLATTDEAVAQIGERVGVYNVPYFTTLFKKKYGITPSQYREQAARGKG